MVEKISKKKAKTKLKRPRLRSEDCVKRDKKSIEQGIHSRPEAPKNRDKCRRLCKTEWSQRP